MNDKKQLDKEAYLAAAGNCLDRARKELKGACRVCNGKFFEECYSWNAKLFYPERFEIIRKHLKEAEEFKARGLKFLEMAEHLEKE